MDGIKNITVEFRDSEISTINVVPEAVAVKFSVAYVHHSDDRPALHSGSSYLQALKLSCLDAKVIVHDDGCVGRISDGSLVIDGVKMGVIPIPFDRAGESMLDLVFANGSRFSVECSRVVVRVEGEARFVESFPC